MPNQGCLKISTGHSTCQLEKRILHNHSARKVGAQRGKHCACPSMQSVKALEKLTECSWKLSSNTHLTNLHLILCKMFDALKRRVLVILVLSKLHVGITCSPPLPDNVPYVGADLHNHPLIPCILGFRIQRYLVPVVLNTPILILRAWVCVCIRV